MANAVSEIRTTRYCIHPYFGFVCTPNAVLDFAETISTPLDHPAVAHIDAWGFRNRDLPAVKPPHETWIGLFGGSVAFSVASSCNETTIAGYLEATLNATATNGRRFRVLNFALPAGQQPQPLLILALKADLLDGAVTFDGVNEAVIPAYYNGSSIPVHYPFRPFYETLFARSFTDEQRAIQWNIEDEERRLAAMPDSIWSRWGAARRRARIARLTAELQAMTPADAALQSIFPRLEGGSGAHIDAGIDNWRDCTRSMHALARGRGIEIVSILQPVPERQKPLTKREQGFLQPHPQVVDIRARAYGRLSAHAAALASEGLACLDFSDVFADRTDDVYVDLIHFNDRGCEIVAARMAAQLRGTWTCVAGSGA